MLNSEEKTSPTFAVRCDKFTNDVNAFAKQASLYMTVTAIADQVSELNHGLNAIDRAMAAAISAKTPTVSATPVLPTFTPASKAAPIIVDVPTFDGDPTNWSSFERMFRAAIKTRGSGLSNTDIRSTLIKSLTFKPARELVPDAHDLDVPLDDLLEPLQERFGAPSKVLPALVKRILAPNMFQPTYDSLVAADSQLCVTYDSIKATTGDSLSKFLAFVSLAHFDKSLLESWDIYARDKITFPTMEDVRKFLSVSLIHKSPSYDPSSAAATTSSLPPSSSSNPFATVITPSIPSHLPLPQRPQLPKKSHTRCVACDQYHGLLRCPTFNAMDVDRRNKLVREKRLCINCFSSQHGCKSCTRKFSCRTCNAKHHTLLHKDRVSASPQSAPATSDSPAAMTVSSSGDSAPADSDQELKPAFLHTVILWRTTATLLVPALFSTPVPVYLSSPRS